MLNARQRAVLTVAAVLAGLMVLFPPFFDVGGIFGRVRIAFLLWPPAPNLAVDYRPAISGQTLALQLVAVVSFAVAAVAAFGDRPNRPRASALAAGGFAALMVAVGTIVFSLRNPGRGWTAAPFLACLIPLQYPGGYFLFWLRIAWLGVLTLLAVTTLERRPRPAVLAIYTVSVLLVSAITLPALFR